MPNPKPLSADESRPMYRQLEQIIEDQIRAGEYKEGDQIPSLSELCRTYNVSHITVRRAISELAKKGLIVNRQGKGAFVRGANTARAADVALVLPVATGYEDAYFSMLMRGAQAELQHQGVQNRVVLAAGRGLSRTDEAQLQQGIASRDIQGLLFLGATDEEVILPLLRTGVPVVTIHDYEHLRCARVLSDVAAIGRELADLMIRCGHRRIALLLSPLSAGSAQYPSASTQMLSGVTQAITRAGLSEDVLTVVETELDETVAPQQGGCPQAMPAIRELLGQSAPPTGIIASRHAFLYAVRQAAMEQGLSIPQDVSLIGLANEGLDPAYTVRFYSVAEHASQAANLLIRLIRGDVAETAPVEYVPHTFHEGETCASQEGAANGHHQRLVPWPGAKRFSDTRVLGLTGYYHDKDPRHARAKDYYDIILDFPLAVHEVNGLYGWVDWPDAPDFDRPKDGKFNTKPFRGGQGWSNGERLMPAYLWHYMATGTRRALDVGMDMALHNMGFDIEHEGGDQLTGMPHRHNQVHWGDSGGPRQMAWRGWYMAWWLFGHNEIMRSIREAHPMPMGIAANSNVARWPHHPTRPKQHGWYIQPKDTAVFVYGPNGTPFTFMNLMRWQTTGDDEFVRFADQIAQGYAANIYVLKGKKKIAPEGFRVGLKDGALIPHPKQLTEAITFENPTRPHCMTYYFNTYGGGTILSEWAQLTGSKAAIDSILHMGDFFAADSRGSKRIDIINSGKRGGVNPWQKYMAREGMGPAYVLLRLKDHPELARRLIKAMEWRAHRWAYGSPRKMKKGSKPAKDPHSYTAESWTRMNVKCYGKNGPKIHTAHALEVLYTLWYSLPDKD